MGIINRLALIIFFLLSFVILLIISIINVKFASIYLSWMTERVFKFLYGTKESKI